jgi:hypothetical protein
MLHGLEAWRYEHAGLAPEKDQLDMSDDDTDLLAESFLMSPRAVELCQEVTPAAKTDELRARA